MYRYLRIYVRVRVWMQIDTHINLYLFSYLNSANDSREYACNLNFNVIIC